MAAALLRFLLRSLARLICACGTVSHDHCARDPRSARFQRHLETRARFRADARGCVRGIAAPLHVIGYSLAKPESEGQERHDACNRLEALLDPTDRDHRHATTSCQVGTPAREIARYAADNAIDLIVMGTHSHDPTFQMITGSIAEVVMGMAPCAVLAVKGAGAAPCETALDPVAVATDRS